MNWKDKTLEQIIGGKYPDGSLYLKAFLLDYAKVKGVSPESLDPSCNNCLRRYYKEYKLKTNIMKQNCDYLLQQRYNGLPLKVGGAEYVTNENITNEKAQTLIKRYLDVYKDRSEDFNPALIFEKFPKSWNKKVKVEATESIPEAPAEETTSEASTATNDADLSLAELRKKYPNIKSTSKAGFLEKIKA